MHAHAAAQQPACKHLHEDEGVEYKRVALRLARLCRGIHLQERLRRATAQLLLAPGHHAMSFAGASVHLSAVLELMLDGASRMVHRAFLPDKRVWVGLVCSGSRPHVAACKKVMSYATKAHCCPVRTCTEAPRVAVCMPASAAPHMRTDGRSLR